MPIYSLTEMQKCALARLYIAYFAVCTVYGSGKICKKKKKTDTESIKYSANQVWEMGMIARKELLPVVAAQTLRW